MKRLDWKVLLSVIGLSLTGFTGIQREAGVVNRQIEKAKFKLASSLELMAGRDAYEIWQIELKVREEDGWRSAEIGDFLAELEGVAANTGVPILNVKPHPLEESKEKDTLGAEVEIEGDMPSVSYFLYEAVHLPGLVQLEKLTLTEAGGGEGGGVSAHFLISRKTRAAK